MASGLIVKNVISQFGCVIPPFLQRGYFDRLRTNRLWTFKLLQFGYDCQIIAVSYLRRANGKRICPRLREIVKRLVVRLTGKLPAILFFPAILFCARYILKRQEEKPVYTITQRGETKEITNIFREIPSPIYLPGIIQKLRKVNSRFSERKSYIQPHKCIHLLFCDEIQCCI